MLLASAKKKLPQSPETRTVSVSGRTEISHGAHRIIAGEVKGNCQAIAYLAQRKIDTASGETIEEAVAELKARLDERTARQHEDRRDGVPTAAEFREALVSLPPTQKAVILPLLAAHGRMPDACVGLSDLARRFRLDETAAIAAYNRLGRSMTSLLGFSPPTDGFDKKHTAIASIAFPAPDAEGSGLLLRLRAELVAALQGRAAPAAVQE